MPASANIEALIGKLSRYRAVLARAMPVSRSWTGRFPGACVSSRTSGANDG
jgi:hypothetical protein